MISIKLWILLIKKTKLERKELEKKIESPTRQNKTLFSLKIVGRALIVGLVTFSIGFLIFNFGSLQTDEKEPTEEVIKDNSIQFSDSIPEKQENIEKEALLFSIDSLNMLFIQEVSGNNGTTTPGYGKQAKLIEKKIDSLKSELDKIK